MKNLYPIHSELKSMLYPTERLWLVWGLSASIPIIIVLFMLFFKSIWILILVVLVAISFYSLVSSYARANLNANAVKVSQNNFPEIFAVVQEVKRMLVYNPSVEAYIVDEKNISTFVLKLFRARIIILDSKLVESILRESNYPQLKWIIARFIGSLKVKKLQPDYLRIPYFFLKELKIFNIFFLPYERTTQFSGDNIGMAVCGDLPSALEAFDKFMVGSNLSKMINLEGILEQGKETQKSLMADINLWFSLFPNIIDRYLNLLAFARWKYSTQYFSFISNLRFNTIKDLKNILPDYYNDPNSGMRSMDPGFSFSPRENTRKRIKIYKRNQQ